MNGKNVAQRLYFQTTVWWPEPEIFSNFGRHISGTSFRVEASIIIQRHEVPYRHLRSLSDPKMLDLNDLDMPLNGKMFFHRRFD